MMLAIANALGLLAQEADDDNSVSLITILVVLAIIALVVWIAITIFRR
jgi:hypothetical protein